MSKSSKLACPCGSPLYQDCCELLHKGLNVAQSPEQLMRSRYSAFALGLEPYLLSTWHTSTRPPPPLFDNPPSQKWISLTIKHASESETSGTVEFIATYRLSGRAHRLHEISNFVKEDGRWYYVDGSFPNETP